MLPIKSSSSEQSQTLIYLVASNFSPYVKCAKDSRFAMALPLRRGGYNPRFRCEVPTLLGQSIWGANIFDIYSALCPPWLPVPIALPLVQCR